MAVRDRGDVPVGLNGVQLGGLDRMVREDSVADTLEAQSEAVLDTLTKGEQMDLLAAWAMLRDRRHRLPA